MIKFMMMMVGEKHCSSYTSKTAYLIKTNQTLPFQCEQLANSSHYKLPQLTTKCLTYNCNEKNLTSKMLLKCNIMTHCN